MSERVESVWRDTRKLKEKARKMARNSDNDMCKEERKRESFFKVLQRVDISSENMVKICSLTLHVLKLCNFLLVLVLKC